jgi:ubiquinone/menaquinone biosynthesis C-methylase UbiE
MSFVIGDVTKMPFPDKMFDVVVSFETIEHLKEPEKFVDEAWRVLADDGVFIVSAPENSGSVFHRAEYSADGLAALLGAFPEREYYGQAFGLEHTIQKGVVPHSEHDTHIFVAKKTT